MKRQSDRLVYVTQAGDKYHLMPHTPTYSVTWTQRFAERGLGIEPCQVCFRDRRPRHRGQLIEERDARGVGVLRWALR